MQGAMNAGVPMLLDNGSSGSRSAINPEDAQMLESRAFGVEEICRFFGVPPHMVGHTEKVTSWGTGLEQQTLGFQKFTLRRRLKRIEQALEKQLLTPRATVRGITIEFNLEGFCGRQRSRAEFYRRGPQNGWMTINEVRALENCRPSRAGRAADADAEDRIRKPGAKTRSRRLRRLNMLHKAFRLDIKAVSDEGVIEGYASVFGGAPDSWAATSLAPGAFVDTSPSTSAMGTMPLMLWGHQIQLNPPIGNWSDMAEDGKGLWVQGPGSIWKIRWASGFTGLKRKAMKGLSIGYETIESENDPKRPGVRMLKKRRPVGGLAVNFPAQRRRRRYREKLHSGGKLPSLPEFEEFLREAGFSKTQATAIAGKGLAPSAPE
jgi:HK97 family phage prohead protease